MEAQRGITSEIDKENVEEILKVDAVMGELKKSIRRKWRR